jgi:hypothetical protein
MNMLEKRLARATVLMDEVASIANAHSAEATSIQLADISIAGLSFVSPEKLVHQSSNAWSVRFSLPGKPRLHFASVALMAPPIHDEAGFRYTARFVTLDPHTVDHIVQVLNPASPEEMADQAGGRPGTAAPSACGRQA